MTSVGLVSQSPEPSGDVILCALLLRHLEDLLRLPELNHLAKQEERGEIRHTCRLLHVVRNNYDRVVVLQRVDQILDLRC